MRPIHPDILAKLEARGEDEVRLLLSAGRFYPPEQMTDAIWWLAERSRQERLSNESTMSEQLALARKSNRIATQARNAALAALLVTVAVALAGLLFR
jgi:hypothetical protein